MKSILRSSLPILLVAAAVTPCVAHADPNNPTDNDKAAARPFAVEGLRLAQAGNCREAVDKLERGEALVHAPTTAVPLAQCDIQLGKVIAGTEILNRVINESLPPNAPASWGEAQKQARTALDAAQPRIAKLRIHVDLPPGVQPNPEVTVDGQPVAAVLLDNDRPTDPGAHHVIARQAGLGSAEVDVTLADGQVKPVSLRLGGAGAPVAAGPPPPGAPPDPYGQNGAAVTTSSSSDTDSMPVALEFGARLAFGVPFGSASGGNGYVLVHLFSFSIVHIWLETGVRLASHWYVGGYFSYGIDSLSSDTFSGCNNPGIGCSSYDMRLGINAQYHVLPDGRFDPWFGLGSGYEWASISVSADAAHSGTGAPTNASEGESGFEFINLQGGLDFRLLEGTLGIGPFVSFAISQYTQQSIASDLNGGTTGSSITNQALHEWFFVGAHGDYDLKLH